MFQLRNITGLKLRYENDDMLLIIYLLELKSSDSALKSYLQSSHSKRTFSGGSLVLVLVSQEKSPAHFNMTRAKMNHANTF